MDRIKTPATLCPRPFLRWAGSKRFALPDIAKYLPSKYGRYFEPFLGAGSLFFFLQPPNAIISDKCGDLIDTYLAIRDNCAAISRYLRQWVPDREFFYSIRSNPSKGRFRRAAEFIYLNKTCWNGLYRVNSQGNFNVPYGRPRSDGLADFDNMKSCANALAHQGVDIRSNDFESTLMAAKAGDFVYLDPPYVTGHRNNGFVDYNETLFSWDDQKRLAYISQELRRKGVMVLVTNADHSAVRRLYTGFRKVALSRYQTLANATNKRRPTTELLLVS